MQSPRISLGPLQCYVLLTFGVCLSKPQDTNAQASNPTRQIDSQRLKNAAQQHQDWVTYGLDYAETRHSSLDEINTSNIDQLRLAWSDELETRRGIEATPIVVDGHMFFTAPWSIVFAYDARTGKQLWKWDPQIDKAVYGYRACCDVVNRGGAVYNGKIYVGVFDGRLVALDADTGEPVWQTVTVDQNKNYSITGAPRVVDGKVIIGNGGAEYGVRGYVSAYDTETGTLAWRTYTVPGDPAKGFESKALEEAAKTWNGEWWAAGGGGTCWDSMAYDPELNLLYVGTGNGSPWNRRLRSPGGGDNLYLSSIIALNPENGELVWHYQTTPGDTWDYTATQHILLADLEIDGQTRKTLMQAPKNGFFYVIDRQTGEFISANNYTEVDWAERIDPNTGRPVERDGQDYSKGPAIIKPGPDGAHNWQPMAYNPQTGLVYFPVQEFFIGYADQPDWEYHEKTWNLGIRFVAGGTKPNVPPGSLLAWDPVKQKEVWRVPHPIVWNGGVLTTAGGLVFQGTGDGRFVAYDARNGKPLWEQFTGTAIIAPAVTYEIDGKQHVTVVAGWGGSHGLRNPPVGEAAKYEQVGRVFTFALDGTATTPSYPLLPERNPTGPEVNIEFTEEDVRKGGRLHGEHCGRCHSAGGVIPNLRYASLEVHQLWDLIVHEGLYAKPKGMPAFKDLMTKEEVAAIQAYIVSSSRWLAENEE